MKVVGEGLKDLSILGREALVEGEGGFGSGPRVGEDEGLDGLEGRLLGGGEDYEDEKGREWSEKDGRRTWVRLDPLILPLFLAISVAEDFLPGPAPLCQLLSA